MGALRSLRKKVKTVREIDKRRQGNSFKFFPFNVHGLHKKGCGQSNGALLEYAIGEALGFVSYIFAPTGLKGQIFSSPVEQAKVLSRNF